MGRGEIRVGELKDALVCVACGWTNSVASVCRVQTVQSAQMHGRQAVRMWLGRHGPWAMGVHGMGGNQRQGKSGEVRRSQAKSGQVRPRRVETGLLERQQPG